MCNRVFIRTDLLALDQSKTFYKPDWFDIVGAEVKCCKEAVCIIDMSSFTKFELTVSAGCVLWEREGPAVCVTGVCVCVSLPEIRPCGCCRDCVLMIWTFLWVTSSTQACWTTEEATRTTAASCGSAQTGALARDESYTKKHFEVWDTILQSETCSTALSASQIGSVWHVS